MKKEIKLIALTMALTLLVSAGLIGCKGDDSKSSADHSGNRSEVDQVTPETWEEVTLNYWNLGNGEQKDSKRVWAEVD